MNEYEKELQERKPYFEKWKNLKGVIVYQRFKNGKLKVFMLDDSSYYDDLYLLNCYGLQLRPQDIKIADSDIIKEYVKQEEKKYKTLIKQLKEKYKGYLK